MILAKKLPRLLAEALHKQAGQFVFFFTAKGR